VPDDLYDVCQFFVDEQYEYVRRNVTAKEAVDAAIHYSTSVGAQFGTTVRVIITDKGDSIAWEWKREEGIIFPPEAVEASKPVGGLKYGRRR
jgi:hypothetical protein